MKMKGYLVETEPFLGNSSDGGLCGHGFKMVVLIRWREGLGDGM